MTRSGNEFSVLSGNDIDQSTSTNITSIGRQECYLFRESIYVANNIGKLALTNDIPPAVAVVVPSTNAIAGTAADAKATGTALYTGYTEWSCDPASVNGTNVIIRWDDMEHKWYPSNEYGMGSARDGTEASVSLSWTPMYWWGGVPLVATRHLITPTKTSQLVNDSGFLTQHQDISGKQDKLPYPTNAIPYAAITGVPSVDLTPATNYANSVAVKATNYTDAVAQEFENGTRTVDAASYAAASDWATDSTYARHAESLSDAAMNLTYDATQLIILSTNAAEYAVSKLVQTNSILSGGPYLTAHQSLLPATNYANAVAVKATNYTDSIAQAFEEGTRTVNDAMYAVELMDSVSGEGWPTWRLNDNATNAATYVVSELARTNSVIANGPYVQQSALTSSVKTIITNSVPSWSDWEYSGDTTAGGTYNIVSSQNGGGYSFRLYNFATDTLLATAASLEEHPTTILFSVTGGTITATRTRAYYSDVEKVDGKINTVSNWVENMDTSYFRTNFAVAAAATRVVCPSNLNQTVQYINAPAGVSTIEISLPKDGMTKDWLVYILATDEISIVLPPANYWATSETVTNKIEASTATALYFSQISDNIYSIGRQDNLVPITVLSSREVLMQSIREKSKTKRRIVK